MDPQAPPMEANPPPRKRTSPRRAMLVLVAVILFVLVPLRCAWTFLGEDMISAAAEGKIGRVRTLLSLQVDPNATIEDGSTALYFAASNSHKDIVELLLARGANPRLRNHEGESPLDVAQDGTIKNILRAALAKR